MTDGNLNEKYAIIVDFGSAKIRCAAIKVNGEHTEIIAVEQESATEKLMSRGRILNRSAAAYFVRNILTKLKNRLKQRLGKIDITQIYAVISPDGLRSFVRSGHAMIDQSIQNELLERLRHENGNLPVGYRRLMTVGEIYDLDGQIVSNPIGKQGSRLTARFIDVIVPEEVMTGFDATLNEAEISVKAYLPSHIGLFENLQDKSNCSLSLDFGEEATRVLISKSGQIEAVDILPIGGQHLTQDLQNVLSMPANNAENYKKDFGVAYMDLVSDGHIEYMTQQSDMKKISIARFVDPIAARMEEWSNLLIESLVRASINHRQINGGIYLTGGSANLRGTKEFLEEVSGLQVTLLPADEIPWQAQLLRIAPHCGETCIVVIPEQEPVMSNDSKKKKKIATWDRLAGALTSIFETENDDSTSM